MCLRVTLKVPCPGDYLGVRGGSQYPFTPVDGDVDRPAEANMAMAVSADGALEAADQARIQRHDFRVVCGGQYWSCAMHLRHCTAVEPRDYVL